MVTATDPHTTPLNGRPFDFHETVETVAGWLRVLHGESPVELRALKCSSSSYRKPHTRRGYFGEDAFPEMAKRALVLNRDQNAAVYFTLNEINSDLLSRCCNREDIGNDTASDADVTRRRWILLDFDPKRIANVSSTDEEKARAFALLIIVRRFLDAAGWPEPIVADSGNGWHLLYRVDLPADDGGIVERILKVLAKRFDTEAVTVDTSVFNAGRICKLYGSVSKKGDHTPQRPWRRSKIVSIPAIEIVPLDLLESLAFCHPPKVFRNVATGAVATDDELNGGYGAADEKTLKRVRQYLEKVPVSVSGEHGHDALLKAANVLSWRWALPDDQVLMLLNEWNRGCQPPWEEDELRRKVDEAKKSPVGQYGELRKGKEKPAGKKRTKSATAPAAGGADLVTEGDIGGWCDKSDLGNARLLVKLHGDKIRHCHPWGKWLVWDGQRWKIDECGAIDRLAKDVADRRWREALEDVGDEDAMLFAVKSASAERISAMVKLARTEPGIAVMPGELDNNAWLLNCVNGTVDLKTGLLRPQERADLITKLCPTAFHPDAESYWWDRFLEAIYGGTQALVDFCRRYFGYSVTGDVREQILLILWGSGSNGKSTLLNALFSTLGGDYTLKAVSDLLLTKKQESHPTERADLFGRRLVVCVETGDGRVLNEPLIKELTGGDPIRARRLYENFWEFMPSHKAALCTNHKPRVRGTDHAMWRRLALLPFEVRFWNPDKGETGPPGLKQDKLLPEKLATEAEGILAWLIRGCIEWQRDGLKMPSEVMLATSEYQQSEDAVALFIAEKCIVADACRERASTLYEAYREWSEATGEHPLNQRKFGESMTGKGFERDMSNGTWYRRIGLSV